MNNIETFISWNCFVAGLSISLFSENGFYRASTEQSLFSFFPILCILVFSIYPITHLFGLCYFECWAHSYFAPGWGGHSYLLFSSKYLPNMPRTINNFEYIIHNPTRINQLLDMAISKIGISQLTNHFGFTNGKREDLERELIAIDSNILGFTYRLDEEDPASENYSCNQKSYWKLISKNFVKSNQTCWILENHFTGFGYETFAYLL